MLASAMVSARERSLAIHALFDGTIGFLDVLRP